MVTTSTVACPIPTRKRTRCGAKASSAHWSTWGSSRHVDQRHPIDKVFIGSCTNSAHRGFARSGGGGEGPAQGRQRDAGDGRSGLGQVKRRPSVKGSIASSPRPASNGANPAARCASHERGSPRAGRALRIDVEPQLRGTAGHRRPNAPGQSRDGRRCGFAGHFVDVRRLG